MLALGASAQPPSVAVSAPWRMVTALPSLGRAPDSQRTAQAVASMGFVAALVGAPLLKRRAVQHKSSCRGQRDGKRVRGELWFDVTLSPPLGLALQDFDGGVVVEQVRAGGSAEQHNSRYLVTDGVANSPNFIQTGDQLLFVNGTRCTSTESAVELIMAAAQEEDAQVTLKLSRAPRGYVTVVFPEDGTSATASGNTPLSDVAEDAKHAVEYRCTDGTCGSCWRMDYSSGEIYWLCVDDTKPGLLPSKNMFKEETIFWSEKEYRNRANNDPNFDNTEPLVLKSCPEVYAEWREANPIAAATSDLTTSRFGGALSGLVGGDTEKPPEAKSRKWGAGRNWTGFD